MLQVNAHLFNTHSVVVARWSEGQQYGRRNEPQPGLRSVSEQFANVPQQSCTRNRKFCKTFANVSILNAAQYLLPQGLQWASQWKLCEMELNFETELENIYTGMIL